MADDTNRDDELKLPAPKDSTPGHIDPSHELPWPEQSSPQTLGDEFAHTDRADDRALGKSFEDPNSLDDKRIGKSFEETNSSHKKKHHHHKKSKPESRRVLYIMLVALLVLFLLVLLIGWLPRHSQNKDNERRSKEEQNKKPLVEVTKVHRESSEAGLVVPGTTIPLNQAYVYARANGYLKRFVVDIGDHVKKDQLLAVIDAPDLDAQVDQARQQVKQAEQQLEQEKSQLALATVTVERYRVLVTKGVLSRQQGDQQEATYASELANVAAAQRNVEAYKANLARAVALQSYEYVRAPFAGVVTQRNADTGALVAAGGNVSGSAAPAPQGQSSSSGGTTQAGQSNNSGSSGSSSTGATSAQSPGQGGPLFAIADNSRLRILVSVPEGYAPAIHTGAIAHLAFQEYPQANITGEITRNANSIDQNTRTMLVEVQVDNHDNKLIPGMYVVTTFPAEPGATTPILIPGDAVVIRKDTSMAAIVQNGKVHLVPLTLGRDFGTVIEVLGGLKEGDMLISNVTDDVAEGVAVEPQMQKTALQQPIAPPKATPPGGSSQYGDQGIVDRNLQGAQEQQNKKGSGGQQKNEQKSQGTSGSKQ